MWFVDGNNTFRRMTDTAVRILFNGGVADNTVMRRRLPTYIEVFVPLSPPKPTVLSQTGWQTARSLRSSERRTYGDFCSGSVRVDPLPPRC
jgi:hypothetical protein